MKLSVIIPAHNPAPDFLAATLTALQAQDLPRAEWELLVLDNASAPALHPDLGWHPGARTATEPQLGLTAARLAGFAATTGEVIVLVDDDNVLAPDYLSRAAAIARAEPGLGTWSGCIQLAFQAGAVPPPAPWRGYLAERAVAGRQVSRDPRHHASTPWGAGMCIRREVAAAYAARVRSDPRRLKLDLQGAALVYGGDTDIAYTGCDLGFAKGVFPELRLDHLIPARRCTREYLVRAAEGHGYSEVLHAWLREQQLPAERPAWRQWLQRLRLPPEERRIAAARARGVARARRELTA
ncbi:MAG: glycosyltransferase family 2 protein [Opitutaceae bacterium]|nr:glycosyltransferase family 2 protein [Opitutaceae bacterium]